MRGQVLLALTLASLGFAPASGSAQTTQRLTLKEAQAIALQNHPQVRATQLSASAARAVVTEVRSGYYPVSFGSLTGATAEHNSRIAAGYLNNPSVFDRYANGVVLSQLITDFGRTQNLVQSANLHAEAQQQNAVATRADILLQVDRAYFGTLRAISIQKVAEETVQARQLVADQVSALAKSQLKSGLDVSFANVNLAQAKLLLVQAQGDVQAAFAELSTALGYSDQRSFDLIEEAVAFSPPPDLTQLIEQAFRDRPDLAGLRLDADAARKFARAERDLWMPSITAVGSAGLIPYRQDPLTSRWAAAGLNINIPIFNGHLYGARRTEANLRADAQSQYLRDLQNRVARDVRLAWLTLNTAFQRLALTALLLDQATQALDLAQARYNLGLSSIVELSQAELNKTEAEIEQARAKYDYQSDLAVLNYQVGLLR